MSRLAHDREIFHAGFSRLGVGAIHQLNDTTGYKEAVRILLDEQNGEKPYYVAPTEVA